jgi:hypothetical protein
LQGWLQSEHLHGVLTTQRLRELVSSAVLYLHWLINFQRKQVCVENPKLKIIAPCKIGDGILRLTEQEWTNYQRDIQTTEYSIGVFIPASGSG